MSVKQWPVERRKLSDLKPAEYNPRTITDTALENLGNSIERFGFLVPIVWNKRSGNVVGGHQRLKCLIDAGEDEADVVVVDLSDDDEVALNITLNNPETRGRFTQKVLSALGSTKEVLGESFNDVGLQSLLDLMSKIRFNKDDDLPPKSKKKEKDNNGDEGQSACIVCPRCKSVFAISDDRVIENNYKGDE